MWRRKTDQCCPNAIIEHALKCSSHQSPNRDPSCTRPVVTDGTSNEILWKKSRKKRPQSARSQYILYKEGTNVGDGSILCNNSIDDNFLYQPSSVTSFTTPLLPVMTSINDEAVVVVSAICGIVRAPNARSLMLWTPPLYLELSSCPGE